jgi:hypothetical protein
MRATEAPAATSAGDGHGRPNPIGDAVRLAVDVAVFAPIGLAAGLVDRLPRLVETGRQRVAVARFVGRIAVAQIERALAPQPPPTTVPPRAATAVVDVEQEAGVRPVDADVVDADVVDADDQAVALDPALLALADYDSLAASHVVARLGGLTDTELADIARYERAHRRRRTVLGKIAQLRGA